MKSLVLRIYVSLVAVLLLFAGVSGWLVNRHFEAERAAVRQALADRAAAWSQFVRDALPAPGAPDAEQAEGLMALARNLRLPLALESTDGRRLATSETFERREREVRERALEADAPHRGERWRARAVTRLDLGDGRVLLLWRPARRGPAALDGMGFAGPHPGGPTRLPPDGPAMGAGTGDAVGSTAANRPTSDRLPSWLAPWRSAAPGFGGEGQGGRVDGRDGPPLGAAGGLVLLLALVFVAVAAAAWPVARRLTRRLETLQRGVDAFGQGALGHRVAVEGRDEVSALARSFNQAAGRIEALVGSHRQLLANASHELRSPLARLKMAVALLDTPADAAQPTAAPDVEAERRRDQLIREVHANIAELDALVDEVLLASRLEAESGLPPTARPRVDWAALLSEEAAAARREAGASDGSAWRLDGPDAPDAGPSAAWVTGDERLLRRAVRNLLQNARRYGGPAAHLSLRRDDTQWVLTVEDEGPGVDPAWRERIFEPFFRVPGHSESSGGVGLGLSLVRQIAERHGGSVRCEGRPTGSGPGSVFRLSLPAA